MKQHKWHKEIKAWADGAEIEVKHIAENEWENFEGDWSLTEGYEFRITTQLKKPQYLYAYIDIRYGKIGFSTEWENDSVMPLIGKIKLEENENV